MIWSINLSDGSELLSGSWLRVLMCVDGSQASTQSLRGANHCQISFGCSNLWSIDDLYLVVDHLTQINQSFIRMVLIHQRCII